MTEGNVNTEALAAHNRYRSMHGCPPLTLDSALARSAQKWAEDLAATKCMRHSDQTNYGENLAYMGSNTPAYFSGEEASRMWYSQIDLHDYNGEYMYETAYFTQMIWKDAKVVGFGRATSPDGFATYIVAHYMPKGNIKGYFFSNVFPPRLDSFVEQYERTSVVIPKTPSTIETKKEREAREKAEKKEKKRLEKEAKEREKREKKELKEREKLEKKAKGKTLKF